MIEKTLNNERGAVLVVGLMILVVLSILGITTMQTSTIEEKMANNMAQRNLALQAAEAALRQAESRLVGDVSGVDPTLPILTPAAAGATPLWETAGRWTGGNSEEMSTGSDGLEVDGVVAQPRYVVELLQLIETGGETLDADTVIEVDTMYRVTARGVGAANTAAVILQVTHLR